MAPPIKVQRGSVTFGASSDTTTASITAVSSLGSAFERVSSVVFASSGNAGADMRQDDVDVTIELTATDTLTFTRLSSGNNSDVTVNWEVWEYTGAASGPHEFKVYREDMSIASASFTDTAVVAVSGSNTPCVPFYSATNSDTGTSNDSNPCIVEGRLANAGSTNCTVTLRRGTSGAATGDIAAKVVLVEFTGSSWDVYEFGGTPSSVGAAYEVNVLDDTATQVSSIDWSTAFIASTKTLDNSNRDDPADWGWVVYPGASSSVTAYIYVDANAGNAAHHEIVGYVIANEDLLSVEHLDSVAGGETDIGTSGTDNYTITTVDDLDYTGVIATATCGSTNSNALDEAAYQYWLTSTSQLRFSRVSYSTGGEFAAQVIQFLDNAVSVTSPAAATAAVGSPVLDPPDVVVSAAAGATASVLTPSLGNTPTYRDTVYYASSTIQADLSQYAADITASGNGAYEASSARTHIEGERNVYYRGDLSTADSEDVLVRHGDQTTATTNTYALVVVTGGGSVAGYHGSTKVIEATLPSVSGSDQDYSIGWSTRANPDATGASDAQISEIWVFNHDTGTNPSIVQAVHAAPSGLSSYTFSVGGWWNGSSMQGSPANAPTAVRVGTTYYSHVQYLDDFVQATAWTSDYQSKRQTFPITRASGLGSDAEWYGPEVQYVAQMLERSDLRLASPLVNEVYRDSEIIYRTGSGLYTMGTNTARAIYAPDGSGYQLCSTYLRWIRVPLTYSRVRVRVNVTCYPTSGDDVPLGVACYSMSLHPPKQTAWSRCVAKQTFDHASRSDREWMDLGELDITRFSALFGTAQQIEQYGNTTHLCLGVKIDPDGESSNDNAARVYIHAWHVIPAGPKGSGYEGPETPPNQQLQPGPGGLSPGQLFSLG